MTSTPTISRLLVTLSLSLAMAVPLANAATALTISGGTAETENFPSTGGFPTGITGYNSTAPAGGVPARLSLDFSGPVKFEYLGSDALFTNAFYVGGTKLFDTTSAIGASAVLDLTAGLIDFFYRINTTSPSARDFANGDPTFSGSGYQNQSILYAVEGSTAEPGLTQGNVVLLGLADGGSDNDNDHQDMTVRVSAVPEPSTYLMMLAGLGVLGFMARRRMPD